MRLGRSSARTRVASGRFARLLVTLVLGVGACQTVGGPGRGGTDPDRTGPAPVIVSPGAITPEDQDAAQALLTSAQESARARRFFEVIRTADELLERYPSSDASGEALWLSAQASRETGDMAAAEAKAVRYAELLPLGDDRVADVQFFRASTFPDSLPAQLDRLLRVGSNGSPGTLLETADRVRAVSDSLRPNELEPVVSAAPPGPQRSIAEARLAVTLLEYGRGEDAARYARSALDAGVVGTDREWAEGVLAGVLPEGRGRETNFRIGVVLPLGGPPALAEFAAQVAEGIEVAAATVLEEEYSVELIVRDDQGDPTLTTQMVAELDSLGVHGIVGLLQDDDLLGAAAVRSREFPLVSPTARSADRAGASVYSLEGADPQAAAAVAAYAVSRAFQRIAIIMPQTPEADAEARAFEQTAAALGMEVVGRFPYEAGATFFEPQIGAAQDALRGRELAELGLAEDDTLHVELLEPTAIFMPIPPEDVEFLAPQAIHFGLDTLAIELLGTTGWTDPGVLQAVDDRLTTGIVATAAVGVADGTEGEARFREAYESYFQRTLFGPTPSIGFDAALILLEALRPGRVAPEQLRAAFESLAGVDGATGLYSVVNGDLARATQVVRIQDRVPVPIVPDTLTAPDPGAAPDSVGAQEIRR